MKVIRKKILNLMMISMLMMISSVSWASNSCLTEYGELTTDIVGFPKSLKTEDHTVFFGKGGKKNITFVSRFEYEDRENNTISVTLDHSASITQVIRSEGDNMFVSASKFILNKEKLTKIFFIEHVFTSGKINWDYAEEVTNKQAKEKMFADIAPWINETQRSFDFIQKINHYSYKSFHREFACIH